MIWLSLFEMGKVGIWLHDFHILAFDYYFQVDVPEVLTLSVDWKKGHQWRIIDFSEEFLGQAQNTETFVDY